MQEISKNKYEFKLFVQEGCRPCMYIENILKKIENWDKVITIVNAKENNEWSDYAKKCGVTVTPTLVALENDVVEISTCGTENISKEFLTTLIERYR